MSDKNKSQVFSDPLSGGDGGGFYNLPESQATNSMMETLTAGSDVADLPARKKLVNYSTQVETLVEGDKRQIVTVTQKGSLTIELEDINKLAGSNKAAKKLFVFTLIKANEQAIHGGVLTRDYVSFPLQDLVDNGSYSSLRSARDGFKDGLSALTSMKIIGNFKSGKTTKTSSSRLEVLFTGGGIEKDQCKIFLNPRINWGYVVQGYTLLPTYYFRLSNRAGDLLFYIFYLARQRTKEIADRGYFTLGFRTLQAKLWLPSENDNDNPYRTIIEPLEAALEEIEEYHSRYFDNTDFQLLPVYNENTNIRDFLDNGYLRVSLSGDFSETFVSLSRKAEKKLKDSERRRERIAEKAQVQALAKRIESKKEERDPEPQTGSEEEEGS